MAALAVVLMVVPVADGAITGKLVSRTSDGTFANGQSDVDAATAISRDGKVVAFTSQAANLPGGDGATSQVYARSLNTGKTKLLSRKSDGDPADGFVSVPGISANGRFVVFAGLGTGLPGADGVNRQVWVADRKTGKVRLVSRANDGSPGDFHSSDPSVSGDGRYVVFNSHADNLPGGDGVQGFVYFRDMKKRKTRVLSKTNSGQPAAGSSVFGQSVSTSGRRMIFESPDAALPAGDGSTEHIYVRNLKTGRVSLVDRNSKGKPANDSSYYASISGNGRFVGFDSVATNLPPGDAERRAYVRDLRAGKTILVGRNNKGKPIDGESYYPHPSGTGRYVVFEGFGTNVPGGGVNQVYVRDLGKGRTKLLSRAANGEPADTSSGTPSISLDGRFGVFGSLADNLPGDSSYRNVYRAGPIG